MPNFPTSQGNENWSGVRLRGEKRLLVRVIERIEKSRVTHYDKTDIVQVERVYFGPLFRRRYVAKTLRDH